MEDKLFLNTKLFGGTDGIIGRRDYFLNKVYIWSISILLMIPYIAWFFSNPDNADYLFQPLKALLASPLLIKISFIAHAVIVATLSISNIFRRLNDITGSNKKIIGTIISAFSVAAMVGFYIRFEVGCLVGLIYFIMECVLFFKKGKITSNYPYDFTKEFNWGAFLGTWIWGLINKTYITLLTLIIGITPWGFLFSLYCGLKGNEWAYKNKKCTDVEAFNENQEKQATIFAVMFGLILPILYFAFVAVIIIGAIFILSSDPNTDKTAGSPTKTQTIEKRMDNLLTNSAKIYFKSYKIEAMENKFYVEEGDWKGYDFTQRKDILDLAASVSANEKEKMSKDEYGNKESYSKTSELNKTKIYGANSKKLLAEFHFDMRPDMGFKEIMKESMKAYRFYEP